MGSIEARGLSKSYGGERPALDDLSFRFEGSGAIGCLGPNGAGKTTTLKLFVGLLRPTEGHALLNGQDPQVDRKRALWDVGALIETPEPYPTSTVFDALETVGRTRGLHGATVDAEIDRCHAALELPPLGQRVGTLSKGQRQRVALAAAMMGDPSVLLLDEPTSGLDPAERVVVRRLLSRLKRDHLILFCSHQMLEVTEVCDHLLVLHRGKLLLQDRAERVAPRLRQRDIDVEFDRAVPSAAMEPIRALVAGASPLTERRWRLSFGGEDPARVRLLEACQRVAPVLQFSNASLVLEEAYLELVASAAESA
jgi:ABC-2 type transport system ATP-binding protein